MKVVWQDLLKDLINMNLGEFSNGGGRDSFACPSLKGYSVSARSSSAGSGWSVALDLTV